jgi:hypothetical protein
MPNFSDDPDAYPSQEEIIEQAMPVVQQRAEARVAAQERMDEALRQMAEQEREAAEAVKAQMDLMTEARSRFSKAALYEQIIEGQLFEGDDSITLEVENEFKAFAEERLMVLLGIQPDAKKQVQEVFEEEELNVLKLFAAKLLGRPAAIPRPEAPKQAAQLSPRPAAPVAPASPASLAAPKRGRGRPPGTGKNQRAAALAVHGVTPPRPVPPAPQRSRSPVSQSAPQSPPPQVADPVANGVRVVTLPNGQIREIRVGNSQVVDIKPVPMPSGEEMVAQAMTEGDRGLQAFNHKVRTGG